MYARLQRAHAQHKQAGVIGSTDVNRCIAGAVAQEQLALTNFTAQRNKRCCFAIVNVCCSCLYTYIEHTGWRNTLPDLTVGRA
jgi:hypothetical protein